MTLIPASPVGGSSPLAASLPSVGNGGVRHEVAEILRQAIWDGRLSPGQRLNEQWISRELSVSRPPLREAIRVLEQEGLVESQPRRGTFVTTLNGDDIMEIYVLRCALEGAAAQALAREAADEVFDDLSAHLDIRQEPGAPLVDLIAHDLEFHRKLVRYSGNRRLLSMWEQLVSQLRLALVRVDPELFAARFVDATHRQLVAAMRARDLEQVRREVSHLLDVGTSLRERWESAAAAHSLR